MARVPNRTRTIGGVQVNFIAEFDIDEGEQTAEFIVPGSMIWVIFCVLFKFVRFFVYSSGFMVLFVFAIRRLYRFVISGELMFIDEGEDGDRQMIEIC